MPVIRYFLLCLFCIALPATAAPPDEQNCSRAIAMAQKTLMEMPAKTQHDQEGLQKLKDNQDKLIMDNRRKGVSECQIWGLVMGNAFKQ